MSISPEFQSPQEMQAQQEAMRVYEPYPLDKLDEHLQPFVPDKEVLPGRESFGTQISYDELKIMLGVNLASSVIDLRLYGDGGPDNEQEIARGEAALRYQEWMNNGFSDDMEPADADLGQEVWAQACDSLQAGFIYQLKARGKTPSEARQALIDYHDEAVNYTKENLQTLRGATAEASHETVPTPQESLERAIAAAQNNVSATIYASNGLKVRNGANTEVVRGGFTGFGSGYRDSDNGAIFGDGNTPADAPSEYVRFSATADDPFERRDRTIVNPETGEEEDAIVVHYKFKYTNTDMGRAAAGSLPYMVDYSGRPGRFVEVAAILPRSIAEQLQQAMVTEPHIARQLVDRLMVTEGGIDEQTWKNQNMRMRPDFESPAYNDGQWQMGIYGIDGSVAKVPVHN